MQTAPPGTDTEEGSGNLWQRFARPFQLWWEGGVDRKSLEARTLFLSAVRDLFFVSAVVIPIGAGILFLRENGQPPLLAVLFLGYLEMLAVSILTIIRMRLRDLQAALVSDRFERDILDGGDASPVLLFLKHQSDLKRYYDQALRHSSLVFGLGIFCVLAGLFFIGASLFLLKSGEDVGIELGTAGQIITGSLGATAAILTGYVARVYLSIHRGALRSLNDFHDKLVKTHHLHFAGVLADRVKDENARDEANAEIARQVPTATVGVE